MKLVAVDGGSERIIPELATQELQQFVGLLVDALQELLSHHRSRLPESFPRNSRKRLGLLRYRDLVEAIYGRDPWGLDRESIRKLTSEFTNANSLVLPDGQVRKLAWLFEERPRDVDLNAAIVEHARSFVNERTACKVNLAAIVDHLMSSEEPRIARWICGIKAERPANTVLTRLTRVLKEHREDHLAGREPQDMFERFIVELVVSEQHPRKRKRIRRWKSKERK